MHVCSQRLTMSNIALLHGSMSCHHLMSLRAGIVEGAVMRETVCCLIWPRGPCVFPQVRSRTPAR